MRTTTRLLGPGCSARTHVWTIVRQSKFSAARPTRLISRGWCRRLDRSLAFRREQRRLRNSVVASWLPRNSTRIHATRAIQLQPSVRRHSPPLSHSLSGGLARNLPPRSAGRPPANLSAKLRHIERYGPEAAEDFASAPVTASWRRQHVLVPALLRIDGPIIDLTDGAVRQEIEDRHAPLLVEKAWSILICTRLRRVVAWLPRRLLESSTTGV